MVDFVVVRRRHRDGAAAKAPTADARNKGPLYFEVCHQCTRETQRLPPMANEANSGAGINSKLQPAVFVAAAFHFMMFVSFD